MPPSPAQAPTGEGIRLATDTPVRIELTEAVSSQGRVRGDKFAIRLATPIVVDGRTVAPAGATGVGEVVYAEHGGYGGSPGKLVLAVRYVDVGDVRVRLKALNLSAGGESEFLELNVASEFIGVAALLITGHDVTYPAGTRARAKVAEDIVLPPGPPAAIQPAGPLPAATAPIAPPASSTTTVQESAK